MLHRIALALFWAPLALAHPTTAQEPVGAVVAWHRDLAGTPPLPAGWTEFSGQTHVEPGSPFHGLLLPDLNGATGNRQRRFLRGARTTGLLENDALQGHAHRATYSASDGTFYGLCPPTSFQPYFNWSSYIWYDPATVTVLDPVSDGVHGPLRIDNETRPVNMAVAWILKTSDAELPLGSIVAWHRDHPALAGTMLGDGWAACDGGVLSDPASPYNGLTLPDLNGSNGPGRFLRGGPATGVLEADALERHRHGATHDLLEVSTALAPLGYIIIQGDPGGLRATGPGDVQAVEARGDGTNGAPRVDSETRPVNMSVVWILKTRASAELPPGALLAYHDEPAAGLPALSLGKRSWYECEGQTVRTPGSPYRGAQVPDLNVSARFLRGGPTSGVVQQDAFQGHHHDVTTGAFTTWSTLTAGSAQFDTCGSVFADGTLTIGGVTNGRVANETRPDSMHVPWILFLPAGNGLRPGLAPGPPR